MSLLCERHQFNLPDSNLLVVADRYYLHANVSNEDGVTLVLAHCSSGHKEQWLPTVTKLLDLCSRSPSLQPRWRIREAWALDAPNHGDSAILNRAALLGHQPLSIQDYADMLGFFVRSDFVKGHSIVAIGHSASTSAWTLVCAGNSPPPLRALILVEPVMLPPPVTERDLKKGDTNTSTVLARQEVWDDFATLRGWMLKRYPWKIWDPRIFDLYLKHGFVEVTDTLAGKTRVTTKCRKAQEVGYYYANDHIVAGKVTSTACARHPVHALFSERPEMVSLRARKAICDVSEGRLMASISIVPKCGHLAVQENPEGVAEALFGILLSSCEKDPNGGAWPATSARL
ncbi:Alpha/beta hydrolase fold-1 [Ganoderma leucocontextum]|nr:Alpha/beta hydrolase fold-1 [Ganoderma leucocontextum]